MPRRAKAADTSAGTMLMEETGVTPSVPDEDSTWHLMLVDGRRPSGLVKLASTEVGSLLDGPITFVVKIPGRTTAIHLEDDPEVLYSVPRQQWNKVGVGDVVRVNIGSTFDG